MTHKSTHRVDRPLALMIVAVEVFTLRDIFLRSAIIGVSITSLLLMTVTNECVDGGYH